jgi:hypothetical protein
MQGAKKPQARIIAGKHSSGAIAAVRARRQANHQKPRFGIAETPNRARPIFFAFKPARRFLRDGFAPRHKARAAATGDNFVL